MTYTPLNLRNGDLLAADSLTHIEQGITGAYDRYDLHGDQLVAIGDSWTAGDSSGDPEHESMPVQLARMLDMTAHNYGVSGACWAATSNLIPPQADKAITDTSYDHSQVGLVLVSGAINDSAQNTDKTAYAQAVTDTIGKLRAAFPGARLVGWANTQRIGWFYVSEFAKAMRDNHVEYLGETGILFACNQYYPLLDKTKMDHPSASGYERIAQWILDRLHGWDDQPTNTCTLNIKTDDPDFAWGTINVEWTRAGQATVGMRLGLKTTLPAGVKVNLYDRLDTECPPVHELANRIPGPPPVWVDTTTGQPVALHGDDTATGPVLTPIGDIKTGTTIGCRFTI